MFRLWVVRIFKRAETNICTWAVMGDNAASRGRLWARACHRRYVDSEAERELRRVSAMLLALRYLIVGRRSVREPVRVMLVVDWPGGHHDLQGQSARLFDQLMFCLLALH